MIDDSHWIFNNYIFIFRYRYANFNLPLIILYLLNTVDEQWLKWTSHNMFFLFETNFMLIR